MQKVVKRVLKYLAQNGLDDYIEDKIAEAVLRRLYCCIAEKGLGCKANEDIATNILDRL